MGKKPVGASPGRVTIACRQASGVHRIVKGRTICSDPQNRLTRPRAAPTYAVFAFPWKAQWAQVVKLADTLSSGGSAFGCGGSSPPLSTTGAGTRRPGTVGHKRRTTLEMRRSPIRHISNPKWIFFGTQNAPGRLRPRGVGMKWTGGMAPQGRMTESIT
jgi:hypothetical protein